LRNYVADAPLLEWSFLTLTERYIRRMSHPDLVAAIDTVTEFRDFRMTALRVQTMTNIF
jgi:hypothetical protein